MSELSALGRERPAALVTGGARRVGAAICRSLAREGLDIALTYRSSRDQARRLVRELEESGVQAAAMELDLDDLEGVDTAAGELSRTLTRLDVLVHNASEYEPSPLDTLSVRALESHSRVNALAPALLTARLAPLLNNSTLDGSGAVIAMCDIHAMGRPRRDYLAYLMSKAALAEMVRTLARDLGPRVRVTGVAPGVVAFPESGPDADPEMQRRYLSRVPLERSGTPQDAAELVAWLALKGTYITGQIIKLDGGRSLA